MKLGTMALLIAVAAMPHADVAAKCMRVEQAPEVWTKAEAKLAADGAVLVGWQNSTDAAPPPAGDPSSQPKWTARAGGKAVALTLTTIAPGLTVYRPATPVTGKLALRDDQGKTLITVTLDTAKPDALAAPKVTRVTSKTSAGFRREETAVDAAVAGVPDAAVALIVSSAGAGAHALSFGRVAHDKAGATTVSIYEDPGHCGSNPDGMIAPAVGSKVTFTWVDASGRLSAASPAVAVEAAKP